MHRFGWCLVLFASLASCTLDGESDGRNVMPRVAGIVSYDEFGAVSAIGAVEYDAQGRRAAYRIYDETGAPKASYRYQYQSSNVVRVTLHGSDGGLLSAFVYEFDDRQLATALRIYDADGSETDAALISYDGLGRRVEVFLYEDGILTSRSEVDYSAGNGPFRATIYDGTDAKTGSTVTEVGSHGAMTRFTVYDSDDAVVSTASYSYNQLHQLIAYTLEETAYPDNSVARELSYNTEGLFTKLISKDHTGAITATAELTYETGLYVLTPEEQYMASASVHSDAFGFLYSMDLH